MRIIYFLILVMLIAMVSACAPLQHHETAWGDAGEVALRVVAFPLTLGVSELLIEDAYQRRQRPPQPITPEQYIGMGLALSSGGPRWSRESDDFPPPPPFVPAPIAPLVPTCTTLQGGTATSIYCR